VARDLGDRPVQIDVPADLPLVSVDGLLVEQEMVNLLENAARYTPPGGPVEIAARDAGTSVEIRIADHGPGLPPGAEERVFEKFYRGEAARPDGRRGVGLGLAICRGIVAAHGGRIAARNRPGGGAEFVITLPTGGPARAVVTPTGLTLPVLADRGDGTYEVQTPCSNTAIVTGTPLSGAHIVLDPGHGGDEPGAVGPNGLAEKDLNLSVARLVADALRAQGATVVLTRDQDVRLTLSTRALIATNLAPIAFVSIHHNAEPDGPSAGPGTEVYFQVASDPSRRLAGLLVEEVRAALSLLPAQWTSDVPNGAVARISARDGGDFYGILRRGGATTTVLSEAAYLSNPSEADLLARPEVQQVEAEAIARGIERFQRGEAAADAAYAPGGPLTQPSGGPGGGSSGCVDPALG